MSNIQKHKPMVWVEVAFWTDKEFLFYQATVDEFQQKRSSLSYIVFPMHWWRNVLTQKIKDFWPVDSKTTITKEIKLSSLTEWQRQDVKILISNMKKNIWREPTMNEIDNMIKKVLWIKNQETNDKELNNFWRFKTKLVINNQKISRLITWSILWFKKNN